MGSSMGLNTEGGMSKKFWKPGISFCMKSARRLLERNFSSL